MIDNRRTTLFLMANLGSEMSQIFSFAERGRLDLALGPAERARKIIEEIKSHKDIKGREQEVEILAKIIENILENKKDYNLNQGDMDEYFTPYALRLMTINN